MAETTEWWSPRLEASMRVARWGHWGQPVLLFPTAGGDAEEVERMGLVDALGPLLEAGRIKLYSCDSVAGRALARRDGSPEHRCWLFKQTGEYVAHEVVAAIRTDCGGDATPILAAGASIGAFNAVSVLCRYPHLFGAAIGMSGTYELRGLLGFEGNEDYHLTAPLRFLSGYPEGDALDLLRTRFVLLAHGRGRWEDPSESWNLARALGDRGIPNRVDEWDERHDHDWPTWREMLPRQLDELA